MKGTTPKVQKYLVLQFWHFSIKILSYVYTVIYISQLGITACAKQEGAKNGCGRLDILVIKPFPARQNARTNGLSDHIFNE